MKLNNKTNRDSSERLDYLLKILSRLLQVGQLAINLLHSLK